MKLKRCSKCKQWKPLSKFGKHKDSKDGLRYWCKECEALYYQKCHRKNKKQLNKRSREYYYANRERMIKQSREYYKSHRKQITEYQHKYDLEHKKEKRRRDSIRRGLGYNPLNEPFNGSVMHHINDMDIIFIPKKIHLKFTGNGFSLKQHRDKILDYYGSIERMINNSPMKEV